MSTHPPELPADDWRRIRDALRYLGRDLHHRSFSVSADRRRLLWEEMDRCLALADQLEGLGDPLAGSSALHLHGHAAHGARLGGGDGE
ncbi:MAG: hypothetical protein VKN13_04930 [Cyanobacteriota bacterium]|nr:hypothetical protein [Cyanobacteriota bacterium]